MSSQGLKMLVNRSLDKTHDCLMESNCYTAPSKCCIELLDIELYSRKLILDYAL